MKIPKPMLKPMFLMKYTMFWEDSFWHADITSHPNTHTDIFLLDWLT